MKQKEFELKIKDKMNDIFKDVIRFSQKDAELIVKGFSDIIYEALKDGEEVPIVKICKIQIKERNCYNPSTKEPDVCKVTRFKPSLALKQLTRSMR